MAIAVDFDGVIHGYQKGWHDGTIYDDEVPDAFWGLTVLSYQTPVFVFTSRNVRAVASWIEKKSDHVLECTTRVPRTWYGKRQAFWNKNDRILVTNWKFPATHYIDDRAYKFDNWVKVVEDLRK